MTIKLGSDAALKYCRRVLEFSIHSRLAEGFVSSPRGAAAATAPSGDSASQTPKTPTALCGVNRVPCPEQVSRTAVRQ